MPVDVILFEKVFCALGLLLRDLKRLKEGGREGRGGKEGRREGERERGREGERETEQWHVYESEILSYLLCGDRERAIGRSFPNSSFILRSKINRLISNYIQLMHIK